MNLYLVGGTVRDHMLKHVTGSDFDFAVEAPSYPEMRAWLGGRGLKVWQERPEFVTLRGHIPRMALGDFGSLLGPDTFGREINADFTLCRAEAMYHDNRHPSVVTPASLGVDLSRRDFTVNAVAISESGLWVDPYGGQYDAETLTLRCVGNPVERLSEDPVRILRAVRFAVTHDLWMDTLLQEALGSQDLCDMLGRIHHDRIREELNKAFSADWYETVKTLSLDAPLVLAALERHHPKLWLKASTEDR